VDRDSSQNTRRPDKIAILFIAEAPPLDEDRYFYFQNVEIHDDLFIQIMRALYHYESENDNFFRNNKKLFLDRFQNDRFYLIDSLTKPVPRSSSKYQKRKLRQQLVTESWPDLQNRVNALCPEAIILISKYVFSHRDNFVKDGFNVLNDKMIPFPGRPQHKKRFQEEMAKLPIWSLPTGNDGPS
jgi:hypothetical protein